MDMSQFNHTPTSECLHQPKTLTTTPSQLSISHKHNIKTTPLQCLNQDYTVTMSPVRLHPCLNTIMISPLTPLPRNHNVTINTLHSRRNTIIMSPSTPHPLHKTSIMSETKEYDPNITFNLTSMPQYYHKITVKIFATSLRTFEYFLI